MMTPLLVNSRFFCHETFAVKGINFRKILHLYQRDKSTFRADDGNLRLSLSAPSADGSAETGRLEIFTNGGWGTVCDYEFIDSFDDNYVFRDRPLFSPGSAFVACRQLGFQGGTQVLSMV